MSGSWNKTVVQTYLFSNLLLKLQVSLSLILPILVFLTFHLPAHYPRFNSTTQQRVYLTNNVLLPTTNSLDMVTTICSLRSTIENVRWMPTKKNRWGKPKETPQEKLNCKQTTWKQQQQRQRQRQWKSAVLCNALFQGEFFIFFFFVLCCVSNNNVVALWFFPILFCLSFYLQIVGWVGVKLVEDKNYCCCCRYGSSHPAFICVAY